MFKDMETTKPTIYEALSKAQASFKSAIKDANNPFFKSKYAPMSSIWDACREGLAENGLFVSQPPSYADGMWVVTTKVYNGDGQFIECSLPIVVKPNHTAQEFGSALTYARRYSLSSILGIVTDDDDAEAAMARDKPAQQSKPAPKPADDKLIFDILDTVEGVTSREEITAIWKQYPQFHKHSGFIAAVKKASAKYPPTETEPAQ